MLGESSNRVARGLNLYCRRDGQLKSTGGTGGRCDVEGTQSCSTRDETFRSARPEQIGNLAEVDSFCFTVLNL